MKKAMPLIGFVFTTLLVGAFILLTSITMFSFDVIGDINNRTTLTEVNVTNTAPILFHVEISPSTVDLVPGSTTQVNCTGYVEDMNGWADVKGANATLYDESYGMGDGLTFGNSFRYNLTGCGCSQLESELYNATCVCSFDVWYYANNGTWQCNMTVEDNYGLKSTLNSSGATVNTVIGIYTGSSINYGNLSVTEYSAEKILNISNFGNVNINVSLRAFGGTSDRNNPTNSSMMCETGIMDLGYQRYAKEPGLGWELMTEITNTTTIIPEYTLPVRTNDTSHQQDTNNTYWMVYVPVGVSGRCNGTIEFWATQT